MCSTRGLNELKRGDVAAWISDGGGGGGGRSSSAADTVRWPCSGQEQTPPASDDGFNVSAVSLRSSGVAAWPADLRKITQSTHRITNHHQSPEQIMGVQNITFAAWSYLPKWGFWSKILHFLTKVFGIDFFPTAQIYGQGQLSLLFPLPRRHCFWVEGVNKVARGKSERRRWWRGVAVTRCV